MLDSMDVMWVLIMVAVLHELNCIEGVTRLSHATGNGSVLSPHASEPLCQEAQRAALLEFYKSGFNATTSSGPPNSLIWFSHPLPDCCNWEEITCDTSGFVITLHVAAYDAEIQRLHFNASALAKLQSLQGLRLKYIDFDSSAIALFSGTLTELVIEGSPSRSPMPWAAITAKLFRLTNLRLFDLPWLDGTRLSLELCNLTHLESLWIESNVNGLVPSCLTKLPHLVSLQLPHNYLEGLVPQQWNATSPLESIDLSFNFLTGFSYPALLEGNLQAVDVSANNFTGSIPQSIGNCTKLTTLSMANNKLSGEIPDEWGKLSNLNRLDLSANHFLGEIPSSIGNCTRLTSLSMANNELSGEIPDEWGKLSNLNMLDLSGNHFLGVIPTSMGKVGLNTSYGVDIDLSSNWLTGDLPWSLLFMNVSSLKLQFNYLSSTGLRPNSGREPKHYSNSSALQFLDLSHNNLTGPIPSWIASLHSLEVLDLSYNMLTSPLEPILFSNASRSMYLLVLSSNHLTGPIPSWLSPLTSLEGLDLSNNQLQGSIPPWLWSLPRLSEIGLSSNQLSGDIHLGQWLCGGVQADELIFLAFQNNFSGLLMDGGSNSDCIAAIVMGLDLHSNDLSGEIPWADVLPFKFYDAILNFADNRLTGEFPKQEWIDQRGQLKSLRMLDLSHNFLSGRIPAWLGGHDLTSLQLSFNNFSGEIPAGLCDSSRGHGLSFPVDARSVVSLKLDHNSLSGAIPDEFSNACKNLKSLVLADNQLRGPIPPSLRNLSASLVVLDLSHNQLDGGLPAWIQQMHSLRVLSVSFNGLSGALPSTIWNTTHLQVLDLSNNNLTGSISTHSFSNLDGFLYSSITKSQPNTSNTLYDESVTIQAKGLDLQYTYLLTATVSLDLSNNGLNGTIPAELGTLDGLIYLNLSKNQLTGQIPESLSNLTQLNSLDVSANELEGEIPEALCALTFLEYVNVSRNKLRGPIPKCTQWGTQDPEQFAGNQGLCGPPLRLLCPASNPNGTGSNNEAEEEEHHPDLLEFVIAIVLGFCIGFPLVFSATIFWCPARRRILTASHWVVDKLSG